LLIFFLLCNNIGLKIVHITHSSQPALVAQVTVCLQILLLTYSAHRPGRSIGGASFQSPSRPVGLVFGFQGACCHLFLT